MSITPEELADIEARATAATEGPWTVCPADEYVFGGDGHMVAELRGAGAETAGQRRAGEYARNGAFIAHARTDVPRLVDELDRMQATQALRMGELQESAEKLIRESDRFRALLQRRVAILELAMDGASGDDRVVIGSALYEMLCMAKYMGVPVVTTRPVGELPATYPEEMGLLR